MTKRLRDGLLIVLAAGGLSACRHGLRPQDLKPATTPAGVTVDMKIVGERPLRVGELFAVDEQGVIVHTNAGRLLRVRWDRIEWLQAERLNRREFGTERNERITPEKARRLALVSRFPHGLEGRLLTDVLAALQQESLDELPSLDGSSNRELHSAAAPSLEEFASQAARAAARYSDRRVAVAEGYRRIGTDFPAMGEHWLRVSELVEGRLEAARPTMLTYATINGQPTLVGTGFVVTTRDDEPATHAPGWPAEWHEHSGLLAEESGVKPAASAAGHAHEGASHGASASSPPRRGTRAWVLHIWTALDNPAGRYQADNWALPFARAGLVLRPDAPVDEAAGRALSLAVGGDRFLREVLTDAGLRGEANAATVDAAIATARAEVERVLGAARKAGGASTEHMASLRAAWRGLQGSLAASAGAGVAHYLSSGH